MPDSSETKSSGGLSGKEVRELYAELRAAFAPRNGEYALARDRYLGRHWDDATNPAPRGRYSLTLNYVRPVVDKTVQLLVGEMPGIQVMPPGTDEVARRLAEAEEAILYSNWEFNDAPLVFRRVAFNSVLVRRGLVYYWWDAKAKTVRFRSLAPDNYFPVYDGEDVVECVLVSRRLTRTLQAAYPSLANKIRSDSETDAVFDEARWTRVVNGQIDPLDDTNHGSAERTPMTGTTLVIDWYDRNGNWTRVMGDAVHNQNLGYRTGKVPVIEFVNTITGDEREPRSEVEDIIELNQYLDQLVSQQADIIKKYANPTIIDYGSGQDAQTVKRTVQGEGAVLPAKRDAKVEYLNWTGTAPAIEEQFVRVMSAIFDLSGKPASSFGQTVTNQSGVMTNMALTPTIASNTEKQTIFGHGLVELNEKILMLFETFMKGEQIHAKGSRAKRPGIKTPVFYDVTLTGRDIAGWYKNRIKWPSALRTDDPLYVQNEISKVQSSPPVQSVYTTLENLGIEDVEAEIDRIKEQLEDPRFHPDVMKAGIDAAGALSGVPPMGGDLDGLDPGAPTGFDSNAMDMAAEGAGNPNRDALVGGS